MSAELRLEIRNLEKRQYTQTSLLATFVLYNTNTMAAVILTRSKFPWGGGRKDGVLLCSRKIL